MVVSDAKLVMAIHPSMDNRVFQAVLQELGSHLFLFSQIFGGVLSAYNVRIVGRGANVLGDIHPYTGKLLLFSPPRTNMLLEGTF